VESWKTQFLAAAEDALAAPAAEEPVDTSDEDDAHADAAGIWICSLSEQSLAPVLFMQAACAGRLPTETLIKWAGEHRSPKPFRRSGSVSLLRGECGIIPLVGHPLHVYSTRLVETVPFERDSALSDWELPVPIAGIVALVENRPSQETTARLFRAIKPAPSRALTWIMAQELPWVIAAVGYDDENISEDTFRELYKLPSYVPIIPGPSPWGPAHVFSHRSRKESAFRCGLCETGLGRPHEQDQTFLRLLSLAPPYRLWRGGRSGPRAHHAR